MVHKSVLHRWLPSSDKRNAALEIETKQGIWGVLSTYLQPKSLEGIQQMKEIASAWKSSNTPYIIGGDVNAHSGSWSPKSSNKEGDLLDELILDLNLFVANDPSSPPFRRLNSEDQWLDVTLASASAINKIQNWEVIPEEISSSDHELISWKVTLNPLRAEPLKSWAWSSTDWPLFREILKALLPAPENCHPSSSVEEIDADVRLITSAFQTAMKQSVPKTRLSDFIKPWFDEKTKEIRNRLKGTPKKSKDHYTLKKILENTIRRKKGEAFRKFLEGLSASDCWKALKRLSPKPAKPNISSLKTEHQETADPAEMAILLGNQYFPEYSVSQTSGNLWRQAGLVDFQTWLRKVPRILPTVSVSLQEIEAQNGHAKRKSAPGSDDIPYLALTKCCDIVSPFLQGLYSGILDCGYFPTAWKPSKCSTFQSREKRETPQPTSGQSDSSHACPKSLKESWLNDLAHLLKIGSCCQITNTVSGKDAQQSNLYGNSLMMPLNKSIKENKCLL